MEIRKKRPYFVYISKSLLLLPYVPGVSISTIHKNIDFYENSDAEYDAMSTSALYQPPSTDKNHPKTKSCMT